MKVFLIESFSYSEDGVNVIHCPAGDADIPDRFVDGIIARGIGEKSKQPTKNKAKKQPRNKAK